MRRRKHGASLVRCLVTAVLCLLVPFTGVIAKPYYLAPISSLGAPRLAAALDSIYKGDAIATAKSNARIWRDLRDAAVEAFQEKGLAVYYDTKSDSFVFHNYENPQGFMYRIRGPHFSAAEDPFAQQQVLERWSLMDLGVEKFAKTEALQKQFESQRYSIKPEEKRIQQLAWIKPSDNEIELGRKYWNDEVGTTGLVPGSRASVKGDVDSIMNMPMVERMRQAWGGVKAYIEGKGVITTMAGGAAARMPLAREKIPPRARKYTDEWSKMMWGKIIEFKSKFAVPIGVVDGLVYTFGGAFLTSKAKLDTYAREIARKLGLEHHYNRIFLLSNETNESQLHEELKRRKNYGAKGVIEIANQELRAQYVAKEGDMEKMLKKADEYNITPDMAEVMRQRSKAAREAFEGGDYEALVLPGEKAATGHGEFFHQMVSSGRLRDYIKDGIQWITIRNIDNSLGTFDDGFDITLKYFLEKDLDFLGEVVPGSGNKGGTLCRDPKGIKIFNEQPAFDANWKEWLEQKVGKKNKDTGKIEGGEGYKHIPINVKLATDKQKALKIVTAIWEKYAAKARAAGTPDKIKVPLMDYPIQGIDIDTTSLRSLQAAVLELCSKDEEQTEGYLQIMQDKDGEYHLVHKVGSAEGYWFNPATAIMRPHFLYYIYRKDENQTWEQFIEEMNDASPEQLRAIADRGKEKYPTLVDAKPAKQTAAAAKVETNLWTATRIAGPLGAKLDYIGFGQSLNYTPEEFNRLPEWQKDLVRFAATKKWSGPVESFRSNMKYVLRKLKQIVRGEPIRRDVLDELSPDDSRSLSKAMELVFMLIGGGVEPTERDWARLRSIVRAYFQNPYLDILYDEKSVSITAFDYRLMGREIADTKLRSEAQMYRFVPSSKRPGTETMLYDEQKDSIAQNLKTLPLPHEFDQWKMYYYPWTPAVARAVAEASFAQRLFSENKEAMAFRSRAGFIGYVFDLFASLEKPEPVAGSDTMKAYEALANKYNEYPEPLEIQSPRQLESEEALESYMEQAEDMYLGGGFVHHLLWGGAAPQGLKMLGGQAKALFNPVETVLNESQEQLAAVEEKGEHPLQGLLQDENAKVKVPLPLGVRQLLQYRMELKQLAEAQGRENFDAVLRAQKFIICVNELTTDQVIAEFKRAKYFGFDPKNVMFVVCPSYPAFEYKDGQWQEVPNSSVLPGHGYPLMQTVLPNTGFYLDDNGQRHDVDEPPLQYFKGRGYRGKLVMDNWNIGDLARLGGTSGDRLLQAIDSRRASMALKLMEQGSDVIVETVEKGEKTDEGGSLYTVGLVEDVQTKTGLHADIDLVKAPHNRFATYYDADVLLDSLPRKGLQQYISPMRIGDRIVMVPVSYAGDVTRVEGIRRSAFQEQDVKLLPFKKVSHVPSAMHQMAQQDQNPEFLRLVEIIYGSRTNIPPIPPSVPPVGMGMSTVLFHSQLDAFLDPAQRSLAAAGHLANAISDYPTSPDLVGWMGLILHDFVLRSDIDAKCLPVMLTGVAQGLSKMNAKQREAFFQALEKAKAADAKVAAMPIVQLLSQARVAALSKAEVTVETNDVIQDGKQMRGLHYGDQHVDFPVEVVKYFAGPDAAAVRAEEIPADVADEAKILTFLSESMLVKITHESDSFAGKFASVAKLKDVAAVPLDFDLLASNVKVGAKGLESYSYTGVGLKRILDALPPGTQFVIFGDQEADIMKQVVSQGEALTADDLAKLKFVRAKDVPAVEAALTGIPKAKIRWVLKNQKPGEDRLIKEVETAGYDYLLGQPGVSLERLITLILSVENLRDPAQVEAVMRQLGISPDVIALLMPAPGNPFLLPASEPIKGLSDDGLDKQAISAMVKRFA